MPLITAAALAAATIIAHCPWPDRGHDKFMGDVPSAVDTYTDIPKATRDTLKAKMRDPRRYDDVAHITATGVRSERWEYGPLTMMHFGAGRTICRTVDTSMWTATDPGERALIYCADGHCIAVPTVCRNVSRIARLRPVTPPQPTPQPTPNPTPDNTPGGSGPGLRMGPLTVNLPPIKATADIDAPAPPASPNTSFADEAAPPDRPPRWINAEQSFYDLWARPLLWPLAWYATRTVAPPAAAPGPVVWLLPPALTAPPAVKESLTPEPPASVFPIAPLPPAVFVPAPGMPPIEPPVMPPALPGAGSKPTDFPDGAAVDAVAAVPEPSTWGLMLGGLLMVGWWARRNAEAQRPPGALER
jgi:hypothetical protein